MSDRRHRCGYELAHNRTWRSRHAPLGGRSRRLGEPDSLDGTPLGYLRGSWSGTGLHFSSASAAGGEDASAVHLSRETVTFGRLPLPPQACPVDTSGESLPGVHYVRCSEEQLTGRPLDTESGSWLAPAEHAEPPDPFGMLHISSAPGAAPLAALGCARAHPGPPALTHRTRDAGRQQACPAGVDPAEIEDPHLFLRRDAAGVTVLATIHFRATTAGAEEFTERLGASGFTAERSRSASIETDLWLQRRAGAANGYDLLQISRRLTRLPDGGFPPCASVATLHRI